MEEILSLKLDADWVVLSACNTGAASGAGAEAASGLGRAFFYAGTRALLVTNWSVHSQSARELVTDLFKRQAVDVKLARGEALRQAMMAMVDGPGYADAAGKTEFAYAHRYSGRLTQSSATAESAEMVLPWNARPGISFPAGLLLVAVAMQPRAASRIPVRARWHTAGRRSAVRSCKPACNRKSSILAVRDGITSRPAGRTKPAVRACVQRTVPHLVEHCRATVGRPMVQAWCTRSCGEGRRPAASVRRALPFVDFLGRAGVRQRAAAVATER